MRNPYSDPYADETDPNRHTPDPVPTPTPTPTPAANPWHTAPTDGNWQAWFRANLGRATLTPAELKALGPDLAKAGVTLVGDDKIKLPNGQVIDVIRGADAGGNQFVWLTGSDGGQQDGPPITVNQDYLAPWTKEFQYDAWQSPTMEQLQRDVQGDPSYQWVLGQTKGAMENNAAAKGLLNSSGTIYDMGQMATGLSSGWANNYLDRKWNEWTTGRDNAYRDWVTARDTFYANQNNPWGKLYQAGSLGGNAAAS